MKPRDALMNKLTYACMRQGEPELMHKTLDLLLLTGNIVVRKRREAARVGGTRQIGRCSRPGRYVPLQFQGSFVSSSSAGWMICRAHDLRVKAYTCFSQNHRVLFCTLSFVVHTTK